MASSQLNGKAQCSDSGHRIWHAEEIADSGSFSSVRGMESRRRPVVAILMRRATRAGDALDDVGETSAFGSKYWVTGRVSMYPAIAQDFKAGIADARGSLPVNGGIYRDHRGNPAAERRPYVLWLCPHGVDQCSGGGVMRLAAQSTI